ncbi:MAG: AbrB/MazE/SpoVT family DNA-binding domain-containing protein [Acidilobaceae archaeon]|nr:AbrB/MazE/SpoVT family DNA-binding domain-containing protein [Acidilobaceae archaeon]MDW7973894.1 AbrB/MazE/SpoVT family DNA-binding domain-containing protein [Sulfolobales archaeon]
MERGDAEERRVLRLGQSSLVVSLPKKWTEKMGLKPGDAVLVLPEGESLRIKPLVRKEDNDIRIEGRRAMSRYVLPCAYILGYDRILFHEGTLPAELQRSVERLPGAIVGVNEKGQVEVKVVLDINKISLRDLLNKVSYLSSQIALLLSRAFEGAAELRELEDISSQSHALRSLSERFLYVHLASERNSVSFLSLSLLTLFLFADWIMLDVAERAIRERVRSLKLARIAIDFADLAALAASTIPNIKRAEELVEKAGKLEEELRGESNDPLAARLLDVVKLYQIMGHSLICVSIAEERGR